MARSSSCLLALAMLAGAAYVLAPAAESFVAPTPRGASGGPAPALAQGYEIEARAPDVAAASGGQPPAPGKINLLFLGLLAGTAVIGFLALFGYGAYSGAGSSL
mmetsp:Transcript_116118/g.315331  ORF Transcript_116118/g.315331 Transcript_116118/m.315331 type:complete len:104 (-) Transcript_116118:216-527(-)